MKIEKGIYISENGRQVSILIKYDPEDPKHQMIAPPESAFVGTFMTDKEKESPPYSDEALEAVPYFFGCGYDENGKSLFNSGAAPGWDLVEKLQDREERDLRILEEKLRDYKIECFYCFQWVARAVNKEVFEATDDCHVAAFYKARNLACKYIIKENNLYLEEI